MSTKTPFEVGDLSQMCYSALTLYFKNKTFLFKYMFDLVCSVRWVYHFQIVCSIRSILQAESADESHSETEWKQNGDMTTEIRYSELVIRLLL